MFLTYFADRLPIFRFGYQKKLSAFTAIYAVDYKQKIIGRENLQVAHVTICGAFCHVTRCEMSRFRPHCC